MAKKAVTQTVTRSDCEEALQLAKDLLKRLETENSEWTKQDEQKLKKLKNIVDILSKLIPLFKKHPEKSVSFSSKDDEQIIRRFLNRKRK